MKPRPDQVRPQVSAWAVERRLNVYDVLDDFDERAAIREYLGGYPRRNAEQLAFQDVKEMR